MAGILKHRYTNPHADVGGSTKTQASHWNDFLMGVGGMNGDMLTRDTADGTYGMKWTTWGTPGIWQDVPFNAANFSAVSPMTFTVSATAANRYTRFGNTLIWTLTLASANAIIGGTAGIRLNFTLPGGLTHVYLTPNPVAQCITGGTDTRAIAMYVDTPSQIAMYRTPTVNYLLGGLDLSMTVILQVQ
jgi:hypothetical protein